MNSATAWLGDIAANPKISNAGCRLAVAIAAASNDQGRYRGRSMPLAVAAQQSSRHQGDLLAALAEQGYIRIHSQRGGRLDLEILAARDPVAPPSEKPYREIAGPVVGVVAKSKASFVAYVDADTAMVKLTIPREGAEAIAQAISQQPS
ncbi:hypothetical protein EET67_20630 [Pseudaminobacter arsenicus]|uniref:Uncharacterized protein n=1 Tax=Borborobacter arsenicus TaxID=1851146 RepID=A0A432V179_9HYPH|nr:hypothetical protein [Pseudaminobacter arsenicus]RUM95929.1 hypothetical protein EET67_20630 [Pseudaminobacter arsenicus]